MENKDVDVKEKFLVIGTNRIRLSNIKAYGVSSKVFYYQKVYNVVASKDTWCGTNYSLQWQDKTLMLETNKQEQIKKMNPDDPLEVKTIGKLQRLIYNDEGKIEEFYKYANIRKNNAKTYAAIGDIFGRKHKYLYITTYQDENYCFYEFEVDFDLEEKCKEIDDEFC